MLYPPNIAVTSPDGRPQVDVEVKALLDKSPEWAADLRHRFLGDSPPTPYFLLALPDRLYFWKNGTDTTERKPDLELKTESVLKRYFPANWTNPEQWNSPEVLELATAAWLDDLAGTDPRILSSDWVNALDRIGLVQAVKGAKVRFGWML